MKVHNARTEGPQDSPFFRIWMCGPFRVEWAVDGKYEEVPVSAWKGRRSPRLLLKALLCNQRRQAQRNVLAEQLWPDLLPLYQRREFSGATTRLRTVLHSCGHKRLFIIEHDSQCYRLEGQAFLWVDADAALELLDQVEQVGRTTQHALPLLQQAAAYFDRGSLLEGDEWAWVRKHRLSLDAAHYRCRLWLAETYAQHKMFGQAQDILHALLKEDPGDEDVLRRLMEVLDQQYMPHQALKVFEETHLLLQRSHRSFSPALITYAESLKHA
ncbi:MAG TPA: tetratricopeptide repeat protein [Ktedonobacteraceae bacterium]|nr:tetratricopeptide repeat protein [Ktedonobacteraceae bacterium]